MGDFHGGFRPRAARREIFHGGFSWGIYIFFERCFHGGRLSFLGYPKKTFFSKIFRENKKKKRRMSKALTFFLEGLFE